MMADDELDPDDYRRVRLDLTWDFDPREETTVEASRRMYADLVAAVDRELERIEAEYNRRRRTPDV